MIGRISGILLEKYNQQALIDIQGVAYEVEVPLNTFFNLPSPGAAVTLHTHFDVREDAQALAMLSGMEVSEFVRCVQHDDVKSLVKLPGVGKKTAERLIIEIKDKLKDWQGNEQLSAPDGGVAPRQGNGSIEEAETALISLGYKPQEASRAVITAVKILEESELEADSENLIRTALKNMS